MRKTVMNDPIVLEYFPNQSGGCIDSRAQQHALTKDGCTQIVKSVQMYVMEVNGVHEGVVSASFDENFPIFVHVDIRILPPPTIDSFS
jgi:hypothetical protein